MPEETEKPRKPMKYECPVHGDDLIPVDQDATRRMWRCPHRRCGVLYQAPAWAKREEECDG